MATIINQPYEVGRSGETIILVSASDLSKLQSTETLAQLYRDGTYFEPRPLQQMLKFLYDVEATDPPVKWEVSDGNSS